MARKKLTKKQEWQTPREEFIFSPLKPTMSELARKWSKTGKRGYSQQWLSKRCKKENWERHRAEFWATVQTKTNDNANRVQEEIDRIISTINEAHLKQGERMITASNILLKQGIANRNDIPPDKSVALSIQASKAGVDFQRKALGLADKKIQVDYGYSLMDKFITIVMKYTPELDRMSNIRMDFQGLMLAESEELRQLIESVPKEVEETARKIIDLKQSDESGYLRWLYEADSGKEE